MLPFQTVHGVLKARILKWFDIPFSSGLHFVRTLARTCLSWVALHGMAHSFIELDKAVIQVVSHSPVDECSAVSCNTGVLTGKDELTSFYSAIL